MMNTKKTIAAFSIAVLAIAIVAGNAMATADQKNASTTHPMVQNHQYNGIGQGVSEMMKGVGNRSGDQVAKLQAMIKQLQDQLTKLQNGGTNSSATTTTDATALGCVKTAVTTREGTIATAFDTLTGCQKTAFAARKTALETAWGIAINKDRNAAINTAWQAFDKTEKECRDAYRKADKAAWDAFKTATKSCNVSNFEGFREGRDFNF
ncbi:MAG: hypothetical protein MUD10_04595 [Candidatus Pacebacteria bacterium]|jgi:hypothetical protein|nr:hypothetical protein [Candidatus Paceibacterota bacterium]